MANGTISSFYRKEGTYRFEESEVDATAYKEAKSLADRLINVQGATYSFLVTRLNESTLHFAAWQKGGHSFSERYVDANTDDYKILNRYLTNTLQTDQKEPLPSLTLKAREVTLLQPSSPAPSTPAAPPPTATEKASIAFPETSSSFWQKVDKVFHKVLKFLKIFSCVVLAAPVLIGALPLRIYTHSKTKAICKEMEENQRKSMQAAKGYPRVPDQGAKAIHLGILDPRKTPYEIYKDVQKYLKENFESETPSAKYVRNVATQYRLAKEPRLAATLNGNPPNDLSISNSAKWIRKGFSKHGTFNRSETISRLMWILTHPFSLLHSGCSNFRPTKYDSNYSNPTYALSPSTYTNKSGEEVSYTMIAGPTPLEDPAYKYGFLKQWEEIRFNLMDNHKKSEETLIERAKKSMENAPGSTHVLFGFDSKMRYLKEEIQSAKNSDELIDVYATALKDKKAAVELPEGSGSLIDLAVAQTKALLKELHPEMPTDPDELKKAKQAMIAMMDTMMAIGIAMKKFEKHTNKDKQIAISIACKQCFDRGPVYFAMFMIYMKSLKEDPSLTKEEFLSIASLFKRSVVGEDRETLFDRFAVYEQFTKLLGDQTNILSKHTKEFQKNLLQEN